MISTHHTQTPAATIQLGSNLGKTLKGGDTVLLFGDLGSGKTHFVKGIARGLGVKALVKSPTFIYVNRYPLKGKRIFCHYDLYRMRHGEDISSLGYEETLADSLSIDVVEWADRLGENLPSRYIRVDISAKGDTRSIAVDFVYPTRLRAKAINSYFDKWSTPLHVRKHSARVAEVAMKIAKAYTDKFYILDSNLLYTSAMLHDFPRICDFHVLDRSKIPQKVTDAEWKKWQKHRKRYKGKHHADVAHEILSRRGFNETAELIRLHKSMNLILEPDSYDTLEKKILYYADKRVMHNTIVSLKGRFEDGKKRYSQYDTPRERRFFDKIEKSTLGLEKQLLRPINLEPEDI